MSGRQIRNLVRVLIGAALSVALVAAAVLPIPEALPAVAVRQPFLYRLEVALLVFYCWLLLVTPAVSGLILGRLPIEISTRGARFAEEADQSTELHGKKIRELEQRVADLVGNLEVDDIESRSEAITERDNSKPAIGSSND